MTVEEYLAAARVAISRGSSLVLFPEGRQTPETRLDHAFEALRALADALEALAGTMAELPEECRQRTCDYFTFYLAQGPKELEHEGFHAATQQYLELAKEETAHLNEHDGGARLSGTRPQDCAACRGYERRGDRLEKLVRA